MKIIFTRYIVAGLIAVSIGFGLFYFLRTPKPAISTYYQLSDLLAQNEYVTFDEEIYDMNTAYSTGAGINATFTQVKEGIDNNFYYYNTYLLFVKNVSQTEQAQIDQKITFYKNALEETYKLLKHFNNNSSSSTSIKEGMHQNFIDAYKTQIARYLELTETLKNYVIKYAFYNTTPVGLKQTLLQVQLDYAKTIINSNYAYTYLIGELTAIKTKYASFVNAPQGERQLANNFVSAYANFENLQEYLESSSKTAYVEGYQEGTHATYLAIIHQFLTEESYN